MGFVTPPHAAGPILLAEKAIVIIEAASVPVGAGSARQAVRKNTPILPIPKSNRLDKWKVVPEDPEAINSIVVPTAQIVPDTHAVADLSSAFHLFLDTPTASIVSHSHFSHVG